MNLRLKLFGVAAALAMCLGLVGTAAATPTGATTPVEITLTDGGSFSLDFGGTVVYPGPTPYTCPATTGFDTNTSVTASTGTTITGSLCLHYTDTQAYRDTFHVDLSASDFVSTLAVPSPGSGFYTIPNSDLSLTTNYNPAQARWSSMTPAPPTRVGDIGATTDTGANLGNNPSTAWTVNNTFDVTRKVATAYAGSGTVGTLQQIDLSLAVPAAMPATTYTSTLTATVTFGTP